MATRKKVNFTPCNVFLSVSCAYRSQYKFTAANDECISNCDLQFLNRELFYFNIYQYQFIHFKLQKERKEKEIVVDTDVGSGRSIPIRQVNRLPYFTFLY